MKNTTILKFIAGLFLANLATFAIASASSVSVIAASYAWIRGDSSNQNSTPSTSNNTFKVGTLAGGDELRGLLSFNLSSIPTNATITSVKLVLTTDNSPDSTAATSFNMGVYNLTTGFTASQVTWNQSATNESWAAGGDYDSTILASKTVAINTSLQDITWDSTNALVSVVQSALSSTDSKMNLLLKVTTSNSNRQIINFRGTTYTASSPRLLIEYTTQSIPESATSTILAGAMVLACALAAKKAHSKKR